MRAYNLSQKTFMAFLSVLLGFCWPLAAQQAGPRLFFTDLESGPNTGGEQNLGTFITIYGKGFGPSRGSSSVTIGGREVARYVIWGQDNAPRSLDMIVVQPGPNDVTGNIVVTVNGAASNPLPFTTDTNHVEVGWNHIHDNDTCRAIQFHSSPLSSNTGYNQYDLNVHDNLTRGVDCRRQDALRACLRLTSPMTPPPLLRG